MATAGTPVVFVHGLWLHADSWGAWVDRFRGAGYAPTAAAWPGDSATVEETRENPDKVAGHGLDDIVEHHASAVAALDAKPILIGHSFGGLIVQRLLGQGLGAAGVAIDPAPMKGVIFLPPSALRVASVALRNPGNRKRSVALSKKEWRFGFGNALTEKESDELYEKWNIPSPGKPLFEAALANLSLHSPAHVDTRNSTRGPLLITAGGKDHTVPASVSRQAAKKYEKSPAVTDLREFPDRGHSLTIDSGWGDVADAVLAWLEEKGL